MGKKIRVRARSKQERIRKAFADYRRAIKRTSWFTTVKFDGPAYRNRVINVVFGEKNPTIYRWVCNCEWCRTNGAVNG